MSASLVALLAALLAQANPADERTADAAEALEREVLAQDDASEVRLVSAPDDPELLDVVAHGVPASVLLQKIAKVTQRELRLDAGEAALRSAAPLDVHLKRRPTHEVVEWVAGAAGLCAELLRASIRVHADRIEGRAAEDALQRAIDGWHASLLRDPLQPDAPRLRFQIGNALYQLGDFQNAILVWKELETNTKPGRPTASGSVGADDDFGDLPMVYFRCGHAYAAMGDEPNAQEQWLTIAQRFSASELVASARLAAVQSFRRQHDETNASLVLRIVIEGMRSGLAPLDLVTAAELLNEGGSYERASEVLRYGMPSFTDPKLENRAAIALARSLAGQHDWHGVIDAAQRFAKESGDGDRAAEMWLLLGEAHHQLDDPFTALLAIRRARELGPRMEVSFAIDLLEGRVWARSGMLARAQPCLERAGSCAFPSLAAPALALHAQLLRDDGQLEAAARACQQLQAIPGHEVEAALALARIFLEQRNRERCLTLIRDTLPLADGEQRAALSEIAHEALRDAPPDLKWPEFLDAEASTTTPSESDPVKEPAHGR